MQHHPVIEKICSYPISVRLSALFLIGLLIWSAIASPAVFWGTLIGVGFMLSVARLVIWITEEKEDDGDF